MMDYKELIRLSKKAADEWRNDHTFYQAGTLIDSLCEATETLLNELDFAIQEIPQNCETCKYESLYGPGVPCCKCEVWTGIPKEWEWRGPQKD